MCKAGMILMHFHGAKLAYPRFALRASVSLVALVRVCAACGGPRLVFKLIRSRVGCFAPLRLLG